MRLPKENLAGWLALGLASLSFLFVSFRWPVALAAWLCPLFLLRFVRSRKSWVSTLVAIPALALASIINKLGAWSLGLGEVIAFGCIYPLTFYLAALATRGASRLAAAAEARSGRPRHPSRVAILADLVFPASFVILEYLLSLTPLGSFGSLASTQFEFAPFLQLASLTGLWGLGFVITWVAAGLNRAWEEGFVPPGRGAIALPLAALALVLCGGSLRLALAEPQGPTVKVAGISVSHGENYWDTVIDQGTPAREVDARRPAFGAIEGELWRLSEKAVAGGARIVFWSEGDCFVPPGERLAFLDRAAAFARSHSVWLGTGVLFLESGSTTGRNELVLFSPSGDLAFEYEKTKSWYASTSDGLIRTVAAEDGVIGGAICFDLDYPDWFRQASRAKAGLILVPAFDSAGIKASHGTASLIRAVENGLSLFRMANEGDSYAVDSRGKVLAYQRFLATPERLLYADLPLERRPTLYGLAGDWLVLACGFYLAACLAAWLTSRLRGRRGA